MKRRYGVDDGTAREAWTLLKDGPYKKGTNGVESSSIVAARPALDCKKSGPNAGFNVSYKKSSLAKAWELLSSKRERCGKMDGYRYDIVDLGRQTLSNLGQEIHKEIRSAFEKKDKIAFEKFTSQFIDFLTDIDQICETRQEYRFEDWLISANRWGENDSEIGLYDKNASMLVTYWGPEKEPIIFDYSWREWSGLIDTHVLGQTLLKGETGLGKTIMQNYASEKQITEMLNRFPERTFLLFPETREKTIMLLDGIPEIWANVLNSNWMSLH